MITLPLTACYRSLELAEADVKRLQLAADQGRGGDDVASERVRQIDAGHASRLSVEQERRCVTSGSPDRLA